MVMFGIFVVVMIILISTVCWALVQTDKCPDCRSRDWEVVKDHSYYQELKCKDCGYERPC